MPLTYDQVAVDYDQLSGTEINRRRVQRAMLSREIFAEVFPEYKPPLDGDFTSLLRADAFRERLQSRLIQLRAQEIEAYAQAECAAAEAEQQKELDKVEPDERDALNQAHQQRLAEIESLRQQLLTDSEASVRAKIASDLDIAKRYRTRGNGLDWMNKIRKRGGRSHSEAGRAVLGIAA